MSNLPNKLVYARRITLFSYLLLLLSFALNAYIHNAGWLNVTITFLPLVIFWPGLRQYRNRTLIWLCFVICMYAFALTGNLVNPNAHWLDYLESTLLIVLFTSAFLQCRWQQVFLSPKPPSPASPSELTEG